MSKTRSILDMAIPVARCPPVSTDDENLNKLQLRSGKSVLRVRDARKTGKVKRATSQKKKSVKKVLKKNETSTVGDDVEEDECTICMENPKNAKLMPCGHREFCTLCVALIESKCLNESETCCCPYCKTPFYEIIQIPLKHHTL